MKTCLRIVVAATVASVPGQGGWTWVVLQWVLGLRRLGHQVLWIDPVASASVAPAGSAFDASTNARYFRQVVTRFGLDGDAVLMMQGGAAGAPADAVARAIESADLLINVSGVLRDEALLSRAVRRVYLDLDPAFTQLWHAVEGIDMGLAHHTDFVTIGHGIGMPDCRVPSCGLSWVPTLQPVVLDEWPVARGLGADWLTTVANWRGYGSIEHDGVFYGQKVHALRELMALPRRTRQRLRLALAIDAGEAGDREALVSHGWEIVEPRTVAASPESYRAFIQESKGEIGIAKTGYVRSRCGWFSDRSVCYLASGRPVVAQDTGFDRLVPAGEGLLAFRTVDEAAAAIERLNGSYARHRRAARDLAEAYFDSDRVLPRLLEAVA